MKFKRFLKFLSLMTATVLVSCGNDDIESPSTPNIPGQGQRPNTVVNGVMKPAELKGFVRNSIGEPIPGVQVGSGTTVTTTDAQGSFALANVEVVNGRTVVDLKKDGYFDVVRSVSMKDKDNWEIVMVSKNDGNITDKATYTASKAETLETNDGMKVDLPANGYKVDATGQAYSGQVTSELLYLNPDDDNFEAMMPGGDLAAVRADNSNAQLVSYGMLQVKMSDNSGNKLQLKDGSEAELTFPIPDQFKNNTPKEIPLWSFNEKTGLWEEEGVAELKGDVYVGKVKHFSWVNLDWPESRSTIKGSVKDEDGNPIPYIPVHVGQTYANTDNQGAFECYVPSDTEFDICVESADYIGYENVQSVHINGIAATQVQNVDIVLPNCFWATGKIVNEGSASLLSTIWITYNNKSTKAAHSELDGSFKVMLPFNYKGKAELHVLCSNGEILVKDIELPGKSINLGEINIKGTDTPNNGKNILYATLDGTVYEFDLSIPEPENINSLTSLENVGGCMIFDNEMILVRIADYNDNFTGAASNSYCFWELEAKDITKSETTGSFEYIEYTTKQSINIMSDEVKFTVKDNKDKISFSMTGNAEFRGYDMSDESGKELGGNATLQANNLTYDVLLRANTVKNITKSQCPSFTPFYADSYPYGLVYESSKYYTKAIELLADCNFVDVATIVKQIQKSGLKDMREYNPLPADTATAYWEGEFYDEANKRYIAITWDKYQSIDPSIPSAYDMDAKLIMVVVDGIKYTPDFSTRIEAMVKKQLYATKQKAKSAISAKARKR